MGAALEEWEWVSPCHLPDRRLANFRTSRNCAENGRLFQYHGNSMACGMMSGSIPFSSIANQRSTNSSSNGDLRSREIQDEAQPWTCRSLAQTLGPKASSCPTRSFMAARHLLRDVVKQRPFTGLRNVPSVCHCDWALRAARASSKAWAFIASSGYK